MAAAAAVYVRRRSVNDYHFNYGFTQLIIALSFVSAVSLMMKIQNAWSWSSSSSSSSSSPFHQCSPSWTKARINSNQVFLNVDDNTSRRRSTTRSWRKIYQTDTPSSFTVSSSTSLFSQHDDDDNNNNNKSNEESTSSSSSSSKTLSYDDTDAGSKGLVGGLTAIINSLSSSSSSSRIDATTDFTDTGTAATTLSKTDEESTYQSSQSQPQSQSSNLRQKQKAAPSSSQELLERLRRDYTERNYLWTGDLDIDCFTDDCRFTDPTISFVGTDAYTTNTQNLVPIVDAFVTLKEPATSTSSTTTPSSTATQLDESAGGEQRTKKKGESILLSIKDNPQDGYIETRWNMVGTLDKNPWLFWKPTIDVIGRTKFWYKKQNQNFDDEKDDDDDDDDDDNTDDSSDRDYYQVWFYDEEWEIPAYRALLQLITPTGTIS